jgi:hypothetical protein
VKTRDHLHFLGSHQHATFIDADNGAESVSAQAFRSREVELATQCFRCNPERLVIQRIRRLTEIVGDTKVVGPTTNHGRAANDSGCTTLLEWPITHCFAQPLDDASDCLPWDLDLGYKIPALANSERHVETEKVETVADMSDAGLFVRQSHTAVAVEHLSDSIT